MKIYISEETEENKGTRVEKDGYTIFVSGDITEKREICIHELLKIFKMQN